MSKVFIILRKEYDYDNDCYVETNGFQVSSVFNTREEAHKHINELLVKDVKENYYIDIIFNNVLITKEEFEELTKIVPENSLDYSKDYQVRVWGIKNHFDHNTLTDEQILKMLEIINFNPYSVLEKEVSIVA